MLIDKTNIEGLWFTQTKIHTDDRGTFRECFQFLSSVENTKQTFKVEQVNASLSERGVLRGIHYSLNPMSQWKWVTCLSGSVWDVVVDIRINSKTYGEYFGCMLSGENGSGLLIQDNLGHSFQALEDNSIVVYSLSSTYQPQFEFEINPLDENLNIKWPIEMPKLSEKDRLAPTLREREKEEKLPIFGS